MRPMELTATQVLNELEQVINKYPDNSGRATINDYPEDEGTCVYYTDVDGEPVNLSRYYAVEDEENSICLVNPICIIGRWIEDFHPEFKEDKLIKEILLKNSAILATYGEDLPVIPSVREVLIQVQNQQDSGNMRWQDIKLPTV